MSNKNIFYLCLIVAFIFYALGISTGYWFFYHWIAFGAFLLKTTFWCIPIGVLVLILWLKLKK
jgi:hypothetical protein